MWPLALRVETLAFGRVRYNCDTTQFQTRTSGPLYRGNQPTSHQIQLVKAFNSVGANLKLLISKSLMGLGPLGCVKNGCPELDILPAVC